MHTFDQYYYYDLLLNPFLNIYMTAERRSFKREKNINNINIILYSRFHRYPRGCSSKVGRKIQNCDGLCACVCDRNSRAERMRVGIRTHKHAHTQTPHNNII